MSEKLQPGKMNGSLSAEGLRFGIVVSRFNSFITDRLLAAAVDALERAGASSKDVDVVQVPGSFELPLRSEEHTSELQSRLHLVCRLLLEKKKTGTCTTQWQCN